MLLMIMLNKLPKVFLSMVRMQNYVRLRPDANLLLWFEAKVMTLWLVTSSFNDWFNLHRSFPWTRLGAIPHPNLWSSQYQ